MTERWKPIVGYEDLYEVSDLGRVRTYRMRGKRHKLVDAPRLLAPVVKSNGRRYIGLRKNASRTFHLVYRLVLEAFVGPCPEGMEACHGDGNQTNDALANLRWDTRAANIEDKRRHGSRMGAPRGDLHHRHSKLWPEAVRCIRAEPAGDGVVPMLAKAFGVSENQIRMVRGHRSWAHVPQYL